MASRIRPRRLPAIGALYLANAFLAFHVFLAVYINSSYLSEFFSTEHVGYLYMAAAAISLLGFFIITRLLALIGNTLVLLSFAMLACFSLVGLALAPHPAAAALFFLLNGLAIGFLLYGLDLMVEAFTSTESETGNVRGLYLTVASSILVICPFIAGIIVDGIGYMPLYFIAALFMVPFAIVIWGVFHRYIDPVYSVKPLFTRFSCLWESRDIRLVTIAQFVLRLFFAWMVVYSPIYLHEFIGFSWAHIGALFTIMLVPYVFLELPLGRLADKKLGEKELMVAGFCVIGVATALLSFVTEPYFVLWAFLLLMTRVGASMVEITTESYFFKHVDSSDAETISCFRMTNPLAYIIAPAIAVLCLTIIDFQYLFVIFGSAMFIGALFSLRLKDTK